MRIGEVATRIYARGDTYPHRDALKRAGFKWSPRARVWSLTAHGREARDKARATVKALGLADGVLLVPCGAFGGCDACQRD